MQEAIAVGVVGAGATGLCPPSGATDDGVRFRATFAPLGPLHTTLAAIAACDVVVWAPTPGTGTDERVAWHALTHALACKSLTDGRLYQTCVVDAAYEQPGESPHQPRENTLRRFGLRWAATDLAAKRTAARVESISARMARLESAFHDLLDALARNARFHAASKIIRHGGN